VSENFKSIQKFEDHLQWWNSNSMSSLREDLDNGIRHQNCNQCWRSEDQSRPSLRQNYNQMFAKFSDFTSIKQKIKDQDFSSADYPTTWELDIGNLCNLSCIMCNSSLSNKIQQEVKLHQEEFKIFPTLIKQAQDAKDSSWLDDKDIQHQLAFIKHNLRWLKIQGGEALAVKGIRDFLETLDQEKVVLSLTSNGTILDDRLLKNLSEFKKVEISISVEAIGEANDWIRHGSNWTTIQKNIDQLRALKNIELQINHVLQATSIIYLPAVVEFCEIRKLHLALLPLTQPIWLNVAVCTENMLHQMVTVVQNMTIQHPKNQYIKPYLENIRKSTKFDKELQQQFVSYISTLDRVRNGRLMHFCQPLLGNQ
jgi:organic radical activating enzyme